MFEETVFRRSRWMRRDRAMVTGTRSLTGEPEAPTDTVLAAIQDAAKQAKTYNDAEMEKVTSAFKMPGLM